MSTGQLSGAAAATDPVLPPAMTVPKDVRAAAERLGVGQYLDVVVAFTNEIFGSFLSVQADLDPEIPDCEYIIFDVPVTGTSEEISDRQTAWSDRLLAAIPSAPRVYNIVMTYHE